MRMTIAAYQTLYESAVAFGMRKALQTEQGKNEMEARIQQLETECAEKERQVWLTGSPKFGSAASCKGVSGVNRLTLGALLFAAAPNSESLCQVSPTHGSLVLHSCPDDDH